MGKPKLNCEVRSYKVYDARKRCRWKRIMGAKLELDVVGEALRRMGLLKQFMYSPNGKVDWIWTYNGWEFECKRFRKTKYVTRRWLEIEAVQRFSNNAERKILVVTKKVWDSECDEYLEENGVDVIVVGRIDSKAEVEKAIERFEDAFLELVRETALQKVMIVERN